MTRLRATYDVTSGRKGYAYKRPSAAPIDLCILWTPPTVSWIIAFFSFVISTDGCQKELRSLFSPKPLHPHQREEKTHKDSKHTENKTNIFDTTKRISEPESSTPTLRRTTAGGKTCPSISQPTRAAAFSWNPPLFPNPASPPQLRLTPRQGPYNYDAITDLRLGPSSATNDSHASLLDRSRALSHVVHLSQRIPHFHHLVTTPAALCLFEESPERKGAIAAGKLAPLHYPPSNGGRRSKAFNSRESPRPAPGNNTR
ncbi:hypothetical protein L249_2873, partial [Ophiocordyceps polyrhachis-furcata BCC 54312]